MMLFPAQRPLESRLRDVCAGTQCALSSPCFLPTVHNLLRPGDFYCIRCPLNFDAGNLCRKQPVGSSPPWRTGFAEAESAAQGDGMPFPCRLYYCMPRCVEERLRHEVSSAERHHHYSCLLTTKRGPQKRLFRCGLSSDYLWEFNTKK